MTEQSGCGRDAAPYVLGALEAHEARAFTRHMERCPACRDEVAALAPVIDALPAAAPQRPVRAALRRRVLRAARAEPKANPRMARRSRRRRPRAALSPGWLALPMVLAAAAVVLLGGPHPRARVITASVGHADLRVMNGRAELIVQHLAALPADRTYELWLQSGRRPPAPSTLFAVASGGSADVRVPGDLHGISRVLVTIEPRGGSVVPSTRPVIQVPVTYVRRL
jgi:anti-sigma-K factor RskA